MRPILGGGMPKIPDVAIWKAQALSKGAFCIVVGNDSFDYEDFPFFAMSWEEAEHERRRLIETPGICYVETIYNLENEVEE